MGTVLGWGSGPFPFAGTLSQPQGCCWCLWGALRGIYTELIHTWGRTLPLFTSLAQAPGVSIHEFDQGSPVGTSTRGNQHMEIEGMVWRLRRVETRFQMCATNQECTGRCWLSEVLV